MFFLANKRYFPHFKLHRQSKVSKHTFNSAIRESFQLCIFGCVVVTLGKLISVTTLSLPRYEQHEQHIWHLVSLVISDLRLHPLNFSHRSRRSGVLRVAERVCVSRVTSCRSRSVWTLWQSSRGRPWLRRQNMESDTNITEDITPNITPPPPPSWSRLNFYFG